MSRAVTNVYRPTRETICSPSLGVAACVRPDQIESFKSFGCFYRLSQYSTVVKSHLTAFATAT